MSTLATLPVTGDGVYYATHGESDGAEAICHRFRDSSTTKIFEPERRIGVGIDVSPDGRFLLYTQLDRERSGLIEGFE